MALRAQKKTSFVYKPRDQKTIKDRANRTVVTFDSPFKQGFDTYTPQQGDNLIRYLPPTWDDSDHYGYTVFMHFGIGPGYGSAYLCLRKMLNKPCPACEAQKIAIDAGEKNEADALKPSERIVSWILNREGDNPEQPVIYNQSWTQDRDITALCVNERTGEILMIDHPDKGFDINFKRKGVGLKTDYYGWQVDRSDSPISDNSKVQDEILDYIYQNSIPSVLNFYSYDHIKAALSGAVEEKDETLDDEATEAAPRSNKARGKDEDPPFDTDRPRGRGASRQPETVDAEEVDEPAPPARRTAARKPEPQDDPEENEEEASPPSRASRKEAAPPARRGRTVVEEVDEETGEVTEEEDEAPPPRRVGRR